MSKLCLACDTPIKGRSDKKFCDDNCRNNYNNQLNSDNNNLVRNINNILRKNRRVLEELNVRSKTIVPKTKMLEKGFNFEYFTSQYKSAKGGVYNYCYEQGYLLLEKDLVMLVKKQEWMNEN